MVESCCDICGNEITTGINRCPFCGADIDIEISRPRQQIQHRTVNLEVPEDVNWTATLIPAAPGWVSVSPPSGTGPQAITVQVYPEDLSEPGAYQSTLQVISDEPGSASEQEDVSISLTLAAQIYTVYFPAVSR